jgi:hypothetical protein
VALTPLKELNVFSKELRSFAGEMLAPTVARVHIDGNELGIQRFNGIHIASMSINLGNVFRLFGQADQAGQMHAIVGVISPLGIVKNLPRMHLGQKLVGDNIHDGPCKSLRVEAIGDELLGPIIDGEIYSSVRTLEFSIGPRIRIPVVRST